MLKKLFGGKSSPAAEVAAPVVRQQLYEELRPRTFDEVVGQDEAIARLAKLAIRGLSGRAYWISGASGSGKTTLAKIIAGKVADDMATEELDSADLTPRKVAEIERQCSFRPLGERGGWAFIVNESHGLRRDTIRQLLVALERMPSHVVWLFTTTAEGQQALFDDCEDTAPLLSRCVRLKLAKLTAPVAGAYAKLMATKAGVDGKPVGQYIALANQHTCNLRAMFQAIESGEF